jgi:hypothetical protein
MTLVELREETERGDIWLRNSIHDTDKTIFRQYSCYNV